MSKYRSRYSDKPNAIRIKLLQDYGGVCFYCKEKLTVKTTTIDHFVPLAKGGAHSYENFRPACDDCNKKKADAILDEITLDEAIKTETNVSLRVEVLKDRVIMVTRIRKLEQEINKLTKERDWLVTSNIVLSEDLNKTKIRLRNAIKFLVHYRTILGIVIKRSMKKNLEELISHI